MDLFLQASRMQLRFDSPKGQLTTEDLWQLPLTSTGGKANLDDIGRALHKQIKEADDSFSLVNKTSASAKADETQMKFEIVKTIVEIKVKERDDAAAAAKRKEDKQRILEIIERKQGQELEGKSLEELRTLAASM